MLKKVFFNVLHSLSIIVITAGIIFAASNIEVFKSGDTLELDRINELVNEINDLKQKIETAPGGTLSGSVGGSYQYHATYGYSTLKAGIGVGSNNQCNTGYSRVMTGGASGYSRFLCVKD